MIKCPYCGFINCTTIDTRNSTKGRVRRNKRCNSCGKIFTTYEVVLDDECYRFGGKMIDQLFVKGKRESKKVE